MALWPVERLNPALLSLIERS
jgi:quinol monooxygenase YgiN